MNRRVVVACLALAILASPAAAQDWPAKPVRVTVPFAAGGAADTAGRLYGEALGQALGQQFVIENRPGGGGVPVAEAMARAEPDGYTLMVSGIPIIVVGPAMRKVGYDPMRDLAHIGYFGGTPNVLTVHPSLGIKTYREFVAYARKQAGGVDYVSAGFGTMGNWNAEYVGALENIKLNHIAYKGGSQAIVDLLAGRVQTATLTWSAVGAHVEAGKLVPLAVTSGNRLPYLPDVPTFRELGHKDFVSVTWFSLSGPPGLSRPILERLNTEINKATGRPEIQARIRRDAIEVMPMTPEQLIKHAEAEIARWAPLIRKIVASKQK
jgi:tripartite-type tricarboxylate transporter receptor subunit TctC